MGLLSVFAQGGYLTLVQRSSIEMKKSTLEMIHINGFNTLPFFTVVSMIIMEPIKIAESNSFFGNVLNIFRGIHTLDFKKKLQILSFLTHIFFQKCRAKKTFQIHAIFTLCFFCILTILFGLMPLIDFVY